MNDNRAMPARLSAFVIWALVAAGLVFWGYRLWARPMAAPANLQTVSENPGLHGDLTRLLGAAPVVVAAAPTPVAQSSRFRLLGVLAPRPASDGRQASTAGVALIAVDGRPARPYAVGARLDADTVLQSISRRSASLGPPQGAASVILELPAPAAPTTGSLAKAVADAEPARAMAPSALPIAPPALPIAPPAYFQAPPPPPPPAQPVEDAADDGASVTQPRRGAVPANR